MIAGKLPLTAIRLYCALVVLPSFDTGQEWRINWQACEINQTSRVARWHRNNHICRDGQIKSRACGGNVSVEDKCPSACIYQHGGLATPFQDGEFPFNSFE